MNHVILCEGADDAFVLGAYFQKKLGFTRNNSKRYSTGFDFEPDLKSSKVGIYIKDYHTVAIQNVGGKDNFSRPLCFLRDRIRENPKKGVDQIFIMLDRDNQEEQEKLEEISQHFATIFPESEAILCTENNVPVVWEHTSHSRTYQVGCTPVVIPFDEEGALETILMNVIKEESEEGRYVVHEANGFVDKLLESENLTSLLQKERQKLKARFSTTLSITNPEHSISTYVSLLESCQWELSSVIAENFRVFDQFFSP